MPAFLSNSQGENRVCSPLNIYLSLSMLAELTDDATLAALIAGAKNPRVIEPAG